MSRSPPKREWTYAQAKAWLVEQDGFSFVMEADGRPMIVVTAWGLSAQIVVRSNSSNANRAAFVHAVQLLVKTLQDRPATPT